VLAFGEGCAVGTDKTGKIETSHPPKRRFRVIHVQHLIKTYEDLHRGRFVAVDRVSFTVRSGEIFGLLGPNGAGKTTVLRILSTVLAPTSGIATVAGYNVESDAADVRRCIGFVSNNTAIYERMTAWEMVEYFGRLHGMGKDLLRVRLETLFDQLRMNDFRDVPGSKMSTGMRQKVSIARAMVHDPPVLVFDEATLGLDVLVARNLLGVIRTLRDSGKCLIFSTHIMSEVERLCDRIAIMHRGRILDTGTLGELTERHSQDDFEELFFGLLSRHEQNDREEASFAGLSSGPPDGDTDISDASDTHEGATA